MGAAGTSAETDTETTGFSGHPGTWTGQHLCPTTTKN